MGLALLFEAIKVFIVKNTEFLVLIAQDLSQVVQFESFSRALNDIPSEVGTLQSFQHDLHFRLRNALGFKQNGVAYSLHAVFNQILKVVSVLRGIEILS